MGEPTSHNIGEPKTYNLVDLNLFHRNPRRGDVEAIAASLRANGVFKPVVVNKGTHTGRPDEVLAGNHTIMAHRKLAEEEPDDKKWTKVEAWVVDVDDDRANRIVLADNRTADLGTYEESELLALLESVDHDLDGTGYDYDDLNNLLAASSSAADDFADYLGALGDEAQDTPQEDLSDPSGEQDRAGGEAYHQDDPGAPAGTQDAEDGTEEIWLALTFSVTVEQRRRVRAVLTEIKNREDLPTQADALVHAIESYPGLDVDEVAADTEAELTSNVTGDGNTITKESNK